MFSVRTEQILYIWMRHLGLRSENKTEPVTKGQRFVSDLGCVPL